MTIIFISIAAFAATLVGGLFALRLRDKLHLILGFSAGAVIAVAFFDLIPEALELGGGSYSSGTIISVVALGFIAYLILDRLVFLHAHAHVDHGPEHGRHHDDDHCHDCPADEIVKRELVGRRGILGAASLSAHSFLDGLAVGLAFQVSAAVGAIVTAAVLVHDFSDGINTVNMILKNKGEKKQAFRWLITDAVAPALGICATAFFTVSMESLALILAVFAGFFLYIGASDLIPESHHAHPKFLTTAMTIVGAVILYIVIYLIG